MKFTDALAQALGGNSPVPYTGRYAASSTMMQTGLGGAGMLLNLMGTNGTLFATVSRYANATSQVCWNLYRVPAAGTRAAGAKPIFNLPTDVFARPNPFTTRQAFIEATQQHLDLVGEAWWVIAKNELGWPESMWLVRPDKMSPVASSQYGLAGYSYRGPDGQDVPLGLDEVIWMKQPNPADPGPAGRGLGAAQTILMQVESINMSATWNRNFFVNAAVPGGVVTIDNELSDNAYRRFQMQFREGHQGIGNAHRVALLENGATFIPQFSQKDMDFANLLNTSRDVIREAFSMPKFMLGLVDDVNRATAEAADATFAAWGLVPRLERIKQALNYLYLPMFGQTGYGAGQPNVEFCYDDPVPPDKDAKQAELTTKVNAFVALLGVGVTPESAAMTVDLPPMDVEEKPVIAAPPPQEGDNANQNDEETANA